MDRILFASRELTAPVPPVGRRERPRSPFVGAPDDWVGENWWERAACLDVGPALFNDPDNMRYSHKAAREKAAKAICFTCAVRSRCLDEAMRRDEPQGVWGGMTVSERRALKRTSDE